MIPFSVTISPSIIDSKSLQDKLIFNICLDGTLIKADWSSFQKHINESLSTPPSDINSFLNIILASAHQNIPHTRPRSGPRNAPWWNSECQRAVALRRRALRVFRRCLCAEHEEEARRARSKAREIILKAKQDSWESFSSNFNRFTPLSKIWSMIKCFSLKRSTPYKIPHLFINNAHYLIPSQVANQFAQHYAAISSSQQYSDTLTLALNNTLSTLTFHSDNTEQYNACFTQHELTLAIQKCGNTSVGPDQIAYPFFKNLPESGLITLLENLNYAWENNSFPPSWHTSTLIPILKPRKLPSDPSSYRPISLTSCASKLFERMINGRIRTYLESNSLLNLYQNGFRPNHSTADGLVQIIDSIQRGFQNEGYTIAVFLDLKNAFDKVNKTALLIKIHKMGIRGRLANFIREFLKERTFNVRCGNTYSEQFNQDHGLPQGSVISPTLFLIMINDIFDNFPSNIKYSLYADDVAFWCTHQYTRTAYVELQMALDKIQNWCDQWGLKISPSKSASIIFSKCPFISPPQLTVNQQPIPYVDNFKYLGVTLDRKLNFTKHFEDITQRCARRINVLKCIAGKDWGADRRTLLRLYTALIRPILDYNAFLFDDIATAKIDSLQIIQNNALRIVTGAYRTSNIMNLHVETNIPLLDRRRKYFLLRFFARSLAKPNKPTTKILLNKYINDIPTPMQRKHPVISYRIAKMMHHFQINQHRVLPTPPPTAYWLRSEINVDFLFTTHKNKTSDQETKQLFAAYKAEHKDSYYIYTDGSKTENHTGFGIYSANYQCQSRLNDIYSILTAELMAILAALNFIQQENIQKTTICSDSASSLRAIKANKPTSHPIIYQIKEKYNELTQNQQDITLLWIPGHSGIQGNNEADMLAKNASNLPPANNLPSPISDVLGHFHNRFIDLRQFDWDINPHHYMYPIKPKITHFHTSHQDTKTKERVLARLRIGHTALTHCHLIEKRPPPICHKCNITTRYTIQHFLIDCPHLHQHRMHILHYINDKKLILNLPTLLGDDHPQLIDLLLEFLHKTKLINNI